jgi:hypothetical protein
MQIDLAEEAHEYTVDGERYDSVTQMLQAMGIVDPSRYTPGSATRGRYLHAVVDLYNKGELDEDECVFLFRPSLAEYKKFLSESGFVVLGSEIKVAHTTMKYAGTLDIRGKFPKDARESIIDVKSGAIEAWVALQLAAYEEAYRHMHKGITRRRFALHLPVLGAYKLTNEYTDKNDYATWEGIVKAYHWKKENL